MISGKKVYSRRVFALHGLLLGAVLVSSYLSVRAQYEALRDQQLGEARTDQQLTTRVGAAAMQSQFRLLINDLASADRENAATVIVPANWLTAVVVFDRATGRSRGGVAAAEDVIPPDVAWLSTVTAPSVAVSAGGKIVVGVPTRDGGVAVGVVAGEAFIQDMQALTQRVGTAASAIPAATLLNEEGRVLAGPVTTATGQWLQRLIEPEFAKWLNAMLASDNAGSELIDVAGTSLLSIQPFTVVPGLRWRVVSIRTNLNEAVSQGLRPLFWQLLSQAAVMLIAGAVVLVSTTVSLTRGRRRIEKLRSDIVTRDLQKARRIQLNWLPAPDFAGPHLTIAADNRPALHISGDFYNWFELPAGEDDRSQKMVIVIGDVSGHGLPAAFLMATTQLLVRNTMPRLRDPGACLGEINRQLCTLVYNGQFVTMMILVIDPDNAGLEIASAGHHAPLRKRDGQVECLPIDPQLVVGVDDSVEYQTQRFRTRPGDTFLLYTDGAIEMTDASGDQFRVERLARAFAAASDNPRELVAGINRTLEAFHGESEAEDDLTLMAAQVIQTDARTVASGEAALATSS